MGFVQYGLCSMDTTCKIYFQSVLQHTVLTVTYFAVIPYKLNPVARIYSGRAKITRLNTHYCTPLSPSERNITSTTNSQITTW